MLHGSCGCGFPCKMHPRPASLDSASNRWKYPRFSRDPDEWIVPYHPLVLLLWGSHMNIQRITDTEWSYYVLKYTTKAEPDGYLSLDERAAELLGLFDLSPMQRKLVASTVCSKPTSVAELMCLLGVVPIITSDTDVVSVNTLPPGEKWATESILRRSLKTQAGDVEIYCERPPPFENFRLLDYYRWCVVRKEGSPRPQGSRWETPHVDSFKNEVWFMEKPMVVRTSNVNPASKPQAFYYQLLVNHAPFRSIDALEPSTGDYLTECARRGIVCCVEDLHRHLKDYLHYNMITRSNLEELRTKALKGTDADVLKWYLPDPQHGDEGITDNDLRKAQRLWEEVLPCIGADSEYQTSDQMVTAMLEELRRDERAPKGCWGDARLRPEVLDAVHLAGQKHFEADLATSAAAAAAAAAEAEAAHPSSSSKGGQAMSQDAANSADHHLPSSEIPSSFFTQGSGPTGENVRPGAALGQF